MKFRPCIDIHNGKVKQIVGGSLLDKEITHRITLFPKKMEIFMLNYIKMQVLKGGISSF